MIFNWKKLTLQMLQLVFHFLKAFFHAENLSEINGIQLFRHNIENLLTFHQIRFIRLKIAKIESENGIGNEPFRSSPKCPPVIPRIDSLDPESQYNRIDSYSRPNSMPQTCSKRSQLELTTRSESQSGMNNYESFLKQ